MSEEQHKDPTPEGSSIWEVERAIAKASQSLMGIYRIDAFRFVLAAVGFTQKHTTEPRHITGEELCRGLIEQAHEHFGPLAAPVLKHWGIVKTDDVGNIVFALVEQGVLGKTEEDSKDDFRNLFDFEREVNQTYNYFR